MKTMNEPLAQMPKSPLELARMHEAELKHCYKQVALLGALVKQIMVGRRITTGNTQIREVTDVKIRDGKLQIYGKPKDRKRQTLICEGLAGVTIVEGAKP